MRAGRSRRTNGRRYALHRWLRGAAFAAFLWGLRPAPASAADLQAGVGAHYWLAKRGLFDVVLTVDTSIVGPLRLGARFGALVTTDPLEPGVPLDLTLRVLFGRAYLEGVFGPWLFFEGQTARLHAAMGFGVGSGSLRIGLEVGWLDPHAILGLNVATTF